jgi:hypothetical protein
MRIKRWGKQSRRIKNVVTCGEPEIVLMELETENLNPDVYRYRTEWGINVVYYIFNFQLMEELIFQPIYLNNSDIFYFGMTENELFKKVLKNTIIMTQPRIMLFPEYLKDLERVCERSLIPVIRELISVMVKIENKSKQLWCVSNILGERGAVGGFYKRLLRKFCMAHNCNRLLVGFSNNDYALLTMVNENTVMAIRQLIDGVGSVRSDTGKITQRKLLIYDYGKDSLEEFEEMDLV